MADLWPSEAVRRSSQNLASKKYPCSQMLSLSPAKGEAVSYAYACAGGPALAPIVVKGITAPSCADEFTVAYEESVTRYIFVGDGTLDSVADPIWELKNKARSTVDGMVFDADNNPAGGIEISAFTKPLHEAGAQLINQTRSNGDGRFMLHLPEGNTFLVAHHLEHQRSDAVQILSQPGNSEACSYSSKVMHNQIQTDLWADGAPLIPHPSKLSIMPEENTQVPLNILGDFVEGLSNYHLSVDGTFDVTLPGNYTIWEASCFPI